jgi:hypothetical protein
VHVREAPEQVHAFDRDAMGDPHAADVPAWWRGVNGLVHRLLGADGLDDGVCAEPAAELLDCGDALVAACLDDVGRAVLAGQRLAGTRGGSWR